MKAITAFVLASVVALSGCQSTGQKETAGTLLGAGAGALAGSQFGGGKGKIAMAVIGGLIGSQMGASVGRSLDDVDRMMAHRTSGQALENYRSGETASWHNPDTGHQGSFTPTTTYQQADGRYCREYQQTITVGGEVHEGYGTACRQPDGSWAIQS